MKETISKKHLREFGLLVGFGLSIFIGCLLSSFLDYGFMVWTLVIALPCLLFAFIAPRMLYYPYIGWFVFKRAIGTITSFIILILVFIVIQPIAYVMRIAGYDPLRRRKVRVMSYREKCSDHHVNLTRTF